MTSTTTLAGACLVALLVISLTASAGPALEQRLANVERLLHSSSGARQVEQSGGAEARAARERAERLLATAHERAAAGDEQAAGAALDQATASMFEAVRLSGASAASVDKSRRDYEERERSVAALSGALERIGAEKGERARAADVQGLVERLLAAAARHRQAGDLAEARRALDGAYDLAKRGIDELRSGDTLVRTLEFASKEEEYHYEVDRNDTHRMLVRVLLDERGGDAGRDKLVDGFVRKAQGLREQAEAQAGRGDFDAAVATLEDSTRELVRAIRGAGVYIPG